MKPHILICAGGMARNGTIAKMVAAMANSPAGIMVVDPEEQADKLLEQCIGSISLMGLENLVEPEVFIEEKPKYKIDGTLKRR